MASLGPGFAGVCIVSMLIFTMVSIFLVTIWSFTPGRFKKAGTENNDLQLKA